MPEPSDPLVSRVARAARGRIALWRWFTAASLGLWFIWQVAPRLAEISGGWGGWGERVWWWTPCAVILSLLLSSTLRYRVLRVVFLSPSSSFLLGAAYALLALTVLLAGVHGLFDALTDEERVALFQARTLLSGNLVLPAHRWPAFFQAPLTLHNDAWFGDLPPAWPTVLAVGEWFGVPWLVNPLIGAATLPFLHALAVRGAGGERSESARKAGRIAVMIFVTSPYVLRMHASFLPDPLAMMGTMVALWALFDIQRRLDGFNGILAGVASGLVFATRPVSGIGLIGLQILGLLARRWRKQEPGPELARVLISLLAVLPFVAMLVLYNGATTGDPWTTPETEISASASACAGAAAAADPDLGAVCAPVVALPRTGAEIEGRVVALARNARDWAAEVLGLGPLFLFVPIGLLVVRRRSVLLLLGGTLSVLFGHALRSSSAWEIVPRVPSEATAPIIVLAAAGVVLCGEWGRRLGARHLIGPRREQVQRFVVVSLGLAAWGVGVIAAVPVVQGRIDRLQRGDATEALRRAVAALPEPDRALVFIADGAGVAPSARPGSKRDRSAEQLVIAMAHPERDQGPLVALDYGEMNRVLLDDSPDRRPWLFTLGERRDPRGGWRRDGRMVALEIQNSSAIVLEAEAYISFPSPPDPHEATKTVCVAPARAGEIEPRVTSLRADFGGSRRRMVIPFHVARADHYRLFVYLHGTSTPSWFRAALDGRDASVVFEMEAEGPTGRASRRVRLEAGRHELIVASSDAASRSVCIDKMLLVPR